MNVIVRCVAPMAIQNKEAEVGGVFWFGLGNEDLE